MMAKSEPNLSEILTDLGLEMNKCISLCGTTKELNSLAYLLLVKAIDILESVHGEEFRTPLSYIIHDRTMKKRVPVTAEKAKKWSEMKKFLP